MDTDLIPVLHLHVQRQKLQVLMNLMIHPFQGVHEIQVSLPASLRQKVRHIRQHDFLPY